MYTLKMRDVVAVVVVIVIVLRNLRLSGYRSAKCDRTSQASHARANLNRQINERLKCANVGTSFKHRLQSIDEPLQIAGFWRKRYAVYDLACW